MRSTLFVLLAVLLSTLTNAQSSILQIGYQEFPTTISGQVADEQGNLYYTGNFKGELTVNGQGLETGRGLEDIFWVKTDASGKVLRYKTFGSQSYDYTTPDNLVINSNGTLTFTARITEPVSFGAFTITPYSNFRGVVPTSCLVTTDTAGTVLWVQKTNLNIIKICEANNIVHTVGQYNNMLGDLQAGNQKIMDSTSENGMVHLMHNTAGQFLNYKTIFARKPGQAILFGELSSFQNNRLLLHMRVQGDTSFLLNGKPAALPNTNSGYYVYVNTDTSYTSFTHKVLNPQRHSLSAINMVVPTYATVDSVYALVCPEVFGGTYNIEGVQIPPYQNTLLVFDSSLRLQRAAPLGTSYAGSNPSHVYKRRVFLRGLVVKGSSVYYAGVYTGINESPINAIPVKDTTIEVLPQTKITVDLNGGSKSFIAHTNLGITNSSLKWYGDHSHYENYTLAPLFFRSVGGSRLGFVLNMDNVWNPWIVDTALNIVAGSMRRNADMSEASQMIQFLPDGSRIVMGYARGKTLLDSSDNTVRSNVMRRDAFICRISAAGQVMWFRRPYSTLLAPDIRKLAVRDNKAYFLINYANPQNDSNFIKAGNEVYDVRVQGSLLASVDLNGNISVLNSKSNVYRHAYLRDFSFFANGDLAVMANQANPLTIPGFPPGAGFYLFRVHPTTAQLLDTRKFMINATAAPDVRRLEIDPRDSIYITLTTIPYATPSTFKLNMYSSGSVVDTLTIHLNSAPPQHTALLKLTWNDLDWYQRFNGAAGIAIRNTQDLFLIGDKPVLLVSAFVNNQPLYWNNQLIHNGPNLNKATLVQLGSDGRYIRHKMFDGFFVHNGRKGNGDRLYLSGYTVAPMQIDTISFGHAGLADAVGIVTDSTFTAKKSFRLSSPFSENLLDFDVYNDTLAAFAYTAMVNPQLSTARMMAQTSDYEEDAFTGTYVFKTQVVTNLNDPLPLGTSISIAPNPATGKKLTIIAQMPEALSTTCYLYQSNGQFVGSKTIRFTGGTNQHEWHLPGHTKPGVYHMILVNKKWRTSRSIIVL
jgi:hypothetical protein